MVYSMPILIALIFSSIFGLDRYYGSTTAAVVLAGATIKAGHQEDHQSKKYKRKDCPVCKGKGWYMSGDGIKKIECSYCEDDTPQEFKLISKHHDRKR